MKEEMLLPANLAQQPRRVLVVPLAEHRNILMLVDGLLVFFALLIGLWLGAQRSGWDFTLYLVLQYTPWFLIMTGFYFFLATANDAYKPRVAADPVTGSVALVKAILEMFILYLLIYSLLPPYVVPRHFVGFFTVLSPFLLLGWRRLYSLVFAIPVFQRRAIVVGAGWAGKTITKTMREFAPLHFEMVGFVDDDPAKQRGAVSGIPVLGAIPDLSRLAQELAVTDVVLAITRDASGVVLRTLLTCYEQGIRISTMAELYERLTDRVPVEHIGNNNWFVALPLDSPGQHLSYRAAKRAIDLGIALVGLAFSGVILPFLAVLVRLDSPGPIFYRQKRVGRGGQLFELVKFRSMTVDAEQDGQARWAEQYDRRVTRVGRLLRATRLDEVPQLLNVLRGEMSLVGPRPERPEFVAQLEQEIPFYRTRLTVKPGLTGWAQVNYDYGRNVVDALEKLRYDLYYIKHQSVTLDLIILLKTVGTIVRLKGI